MELILKEDIEKLGFKDDVVTVRKGYGRNFLIPQGKAVLATPSNKKILAENLRQRSHKEARSKEEAEKLAGKLAGLSLTVGAKAGENGKIFGSVNTIQLADAMKEAGYEIDRKKITIKDEPIKQVGKYEAVVQLYKEVSQTITFEVVGE